MNYIQKQAALQKLAQVRLAINYVMRNRGMNKQALLGGAVNQAVLSGISPAMGTPLGKLTSGAIDGFHEAYNQDTHHLDPVYGGKIQHKETRWPRSDNPLYQAGYNAGYVIPKYVGSYNRTWYPEVDQYIRDSEDAQWKAHTEGGDYIPKPGPDVKKMKPRLSHALRNFGL